MRSVVSKETEQYPIHHVKVSESLSPAGAEVDSLVRWTDDVEPQSRLGLLKWHLHTNSCYDIPQHVFRYPLFQINEYRLPLPPLIKIPND
jgi:hypothetical protein